VDNIIRVNSESAIIMLDIERSLERLADAAAVLGNSHLSSELITCVDGLAKVRNDLKQAIGEDLSLMLRRTEESTSNMLVAAMAGIWIGAGKNPGDVASVIRAIDGGST
jgi:hypothetical protein